MNSSQETKPRTGSTTGTMWSTLASLLGTMEAQAAHLYWLRPTLAAFLAPYFGPHREEARRRAEVMKDRKRALDHFPSLQVILWCGESAYSPTITHSYGCACSGLFRGGGIHWGGAPALGGAGTSFPNPYKCIDPAPGRERGQRRRFHPLCFRMKRGRGDLHGPQFLAAASPWSRSFRARMSL